MRCLFIATCLVCDWQQIAAHVSSQEAARLIGISTIVPEIAVGLALSPSVIGLMPKPYAECQHKDQRCRCRRRHWHRSLWSRAETCQNNGYRFLESVAIDQVVLGVTSFGYHPNSKRYTRILLVQDSCHQSLSTRDSRHSCNITTLLTIPVGWCNVSPYARARQTTHVLHQCFAM